MVEGETPAAQDLVRNGAGGPPAERHGGRPADAHYLRIRNDLVRGAFPPGTILLETGLAERYGVSRTPVREALGRLAQDGFIERSARGFVVRRRGPEEILSIYEARIALESTAAALAAERRTELDLRRMGHLTLLRREAVEGSSRTALNEEWHRALRSTARNDVIVGFLDRLDALLAIYRPVSTAPDTELAVTEHEDILDAVRDRDTERSRAAMVRHLTRMRDLRIEGLAEGRG